ncbi:MAG TPA: hypothetical protein VNN24_04640 [Candidatus Binatus sp.]|nr:hypothetical protein [Candidatus Binatus sp.]
MESGRADVMLHSFDVVIDHPIVETEQLQKIGQEFVTVGNIACQLFSRAG